MLALGVAARGQEVAPLAPGTLPVVTLPTGTTIAVVPFVQLPVVPPAPVTPRRTGLAEIIRAKFPLSVAYADFGEGWRELNYNGAVYYTKGDTTLLNDEEYLVTYRFAGRTPEALPAREYVASLTGATLSAPRFEADDRFEMTLLQMTRLVGYVTEGQAALRSFSPQRATARTVLDAANFSDAFNQKLALIYLGKINNAVNAYSNAYLNVLPPAETAFAAQKALLPFVENPIVFTQPGTTTPFKVNPNLSNRNREEFSRKGRTILFYEAAFGSDERRAVLLLNGTVSRVDAKTWAKLSELSGL